MATKFSRIAAPADASFMMESSARSTENRPEGCKPYPVVYDEGLMLPLKDELCPYRDEFAMPWKTKVELRNTFQKLVSERLSRIEKTEDKA